MSNYFTQFSVMLAVGDADNIPTALQFYRDMLAAFEAQDEPFGFEVQASVKTKNALCLYAEEDGNPDHVHAYVQKCAAAFGLQGRWGFCWAQTCTRPHPDGFGGGALIMDLGTGEIERAIDLDQWIEDGCAKPDTSTLSSALPLPGPR